MVLVHDFVLVARRFVLMATEHLLQRNTLITLEFSFVTLW